MAEANIQLDSERCKIDDFELWKVDQLKAYIRRRGLPVSAKRKKELCALAYAATVQKLPIVLTKEEESRVVQADYTGLLTFHGVTIPDPQRLVDGWEDENVGMPKWPPIMYVDMAAYLLDKDQKALLTRLLNDYKEANSAALLENSEEKVL